MTPQQEALAIRDKAMALVTAFDDAAESLNDRRVAYAALILLMTTFVRSSTADAADILTDFCQRVGGGLGAAAADTARPQ